MKFIPWYVFKIPRIFSGCALSNSATKSRPESQPVISLNFWGEVKFLLFSSRSKPIMLTYIPAQYLASERLVTVLTLTNEWSAMLRFDDFSMLM